MATPEPVAPPAPPETIESLFAALESPLLSYARRLLKDTEMAEDVVQEAFVRLHGQFAQVRERRAWLYRTVHNLALNHQRRERNVLPLPTVGSPSRNSSAANPPDAQSAPDEQLIREESIGLVRAGLEKLDARSRELVRLKFHEELSYREISERTGLKPGHVGYLLHHSLKALAAELARAGLVP